MVPQTTAISFKNGKSAPLNNFPSPKQNVRRLFAASPPTTIMVFLVALVLLLPARGNASETVYMLARTKTCATLPAIYSGTVELPQIWEPIDSGDSAVHECKKAANSLLLW